MLYRIRLSVERAYINMQFHPYQDGMSGPGRVVKLRQKH